MTTVDDRILLAADRVLRPVKQADPPRVAADCNTHLQPAADPSVRIVASSVAAVETVAAAVSA